MTQQSMPLYTIIETGRSGPAWSTCSTVPYERDGIDASKIVSVIVPDRQVEEEVTTAGQLIKLRVQSQPERGHATAKVRRCQKNDFLKAGGENAPSCSCLPLK